MQLGTSCASDIDANFRRESARLLATLTRAFGPDKIDLAEDVVQETFLRAMRQWPMRGVPPNPRAWLGRVARNLAVDILRRQRIYASAEALDSLVQDNPRDELLDDELRMLFLAAHSSLAEESRIALVLKTCCGLSTAEIAKGLLSSEAAVAQRLVRAKASLRESGATFELPAEPNQLRTVLRVLYLLFNEGYLAHAGTELANSDLCDEAILTLSRLVRTKVGDVPEAHALLALMLLHSSRLPARVDESGTLRLLEDQDRAKWDRTRICGGLNELGIATVGDELTPYHCEAAIAAEHCIAPSFQETNWQAILQHYDDLQRIAPSPIGRLNRAIAVSMVSGAEAGLNALGHDEKLKGYYLLPATRARFLQDLGRTEEAQKEYEAALGLATNEAERRFLQQRIATLN